jgi:hypothetical protein
MVFMKVEEGFKTDKGKESYRKKKKKIKNFGEKVFVAATASSHGPHLGNGYVRTVSRETAVSIWGGAVRWLTGEITRDRLSLTDRRSFLAKSPQRWGAWRNSISASPLEPLSTSRGVTVGSGTIK